MATYTYSDTEVKALIDRNIVVTHDEKNIHGDEVLSNAIPSYSIFDETIDYLCAEISANDVDIESLTANLAATSAYLCTEIMANDKDISSLTANLASTSAYLCAEIMSNDVDIAKLTTDLFETSSWLCSTAKYISDEVVLNDKDISSLTADLSKTSCWLSTNLYQTSSLLSDQIIDIRADIKGGVNYKGHIQLYNIDDESEYLSTYIALYYKLMDTSSHPYILTTDKDLNNGWLYYVDIADSTQVGPDGKFVTKDGITLEKGDYIVIHSHDENLSCVKVSDIKRSTIDIFDATDSDLIHRAEAVKLSTQIDGRIQTNVTNIQNVREALAKEVEDREADTQNVREALAKEVEDREADVKAEVDRAGAVEHSLKTDIDNKVFVDEVSATTLNVKHISQDKYHNIVISDGANENTIYVVSSDAFNMYGEKIINLANGTDTKDAVNVDQLSTVSADLQGKLITAINEVNDETERLQSEIDSSNDDIANNLRQIQEIQAYVSADVTGLKAHQEVIETHVAGTFVDNDSKGDSCISSDNLVITDPHRIEGSTHLHNRYYMSFDKGTLVLKQLAN